MNDTQPRRNDAASTRDRVRVTSEIGPLRAVICHTPGSELLAVTPSNREQFLYDDIIDLEQARREHQRFRAILSRFAEVLRVRDLLAEIVDEPEVRQFLVEPGDGGLAVGAAGRQAGGDAGEELVSMFIEGKELPQGPISRLLHKVGYELPPLPNLFFTRDAAMVVNDAVIIGAMKYAVRWTEELLMKALFPITRCWQRRLHLRRLRGAPQRLHHRGRRRAGPAAGPGHDRPLRALQPGGDRGAGGGAARRRRGSSTCWWWCSPRTARRSTWT
jgi:arginine deiminase